MTAPGRVGLVMLLASLLAAAAVGAAPSAVSPEGQQASAPDLSVNGRGELALLWVDRSPQAAAGAAGDRHVALTDVHVAVSRDGGQVFDAPVRVNRESGSVWGQPISRPRIAGAPNGYWHVSYTANEVHPAWGKAILATHYTRSVDGGRSFDAPRRLSALAGRDLSGTLHGGFASAAAFSTLAVAPDGGVHLLWIDTRHMNPDSKSAAIYATRSGDDGGSFPEAAALLETGVCPCCQLMATPGPRAALLVGSRRVTAEGLRPATVARLEAAGPFERVEIGGAPWAIEGCPLKPTVVAAAGEFVLAAAHNGAEEPAAVLLSKSGDGGRSFRPIGPVHPGAAVSDAPAIATNGRLVLLAWHAKLDGPRRVFYRLYDPSGEPRSAIREVGGEPGAAQYPVVAARPDGNFQIAWQQGMRIWTDVIPGD